MSTQRILSSLVAPFLLTGCVEHVCDSEPSGCTLGTVGLLQTRVARDDLTDQVVKITLNKEVLADTSDRFAESLDVMLRQSADALNQSDIVIPAKLIRTDERYIYKLVLTDILPSLRNGPLNIENDVLGKLPSIYVYYKSPLSNVNVIQYPVSTVNGRDNFAPFKLTLSGPSKMSGDKDTDNFLLAFSHTTAARFNDTSSALMYKYKLPNPGDRIDIGTIIQGTYAYSPLPGQALVTSYHSSGMTSPTFLVAAPANNIGYFFLSRCSDIATMVECTKTTPTMVDSTPFSDTAGVSYSYRSLSVDPNGQVAALGGRQGGLAIYSPGSLTDISVPQMLPTKPLQVVTVDYLGATWPDVLAISDQKVLMISRATAAGTYQMPTVLADLNPVFPNDKISAIAVGDINGDQFPDIIVAAGKQIRFLLNQGNSEAPSFVWDPALQLTARYNNFLAMTVADMDHDGLVDIVVSEVDLTANTITSSPSFIDIFYTHRL